MTESPDLASTLEAMPAREVLCFRGLPHARRATVGAEVVLDGPCAASTDVGVATGNFSTPAVMAILTGGARRVIHRGRVHDAEVVLMPGTRLRVVGQASSDDLVVTLVAEADGEADPDVAAADVGSRAAQAIRRDRAHEPHPDLEPGRYVGEPAASPEGTWDPRALASAERPDFNAMSPTEVAAWYAERARSSAERFRDAPAGPLNPMKQRDHPHLRQVGWEIRFTPGHPCTLARDDGLHAGEVVGLRDTAGAGPVLVVRAGGAWACDRADGEPWAEAADAVSGRSATRDVPVRATPLASADDPSSAAGEPVRATLRTVVDRSGRGR